MKIPTQIQNLERIATEMNTLDVLNDLYEVELSSDDMKIKSGIN